MTKLLTDPCCEELATHLNDGEIHLYYSPRERFYAIDYKSRYGGGVQVINYCPWCGKKFPKDLIKELNHIIFEELQLNPLDKDYKKKLPKEFKTDEWWKKRGL